MHPSSLLSYYPTYAILDEVIAKKQYRKVNLYLDLKNSLKATYMKDAVINILETSKKAQFKDTSIFSSLVTFISFHKMYAHKRGIEFNFYIFFEMGSSSYHLNIDKNYKKSRLLDDFFGLQREDRDKFFEILQANFQLIEKACNRMPHIKVIRIPRLEADFVPYYLMTRKLVDCGEHTVNIIYSNDHDMYQCVSDNCCVFSRTGGTKKIVGKNQAFSQYFKFEAPYPDEYFPLALAMIGDIGDDVVGVKGVGPKNFIKIIDDVHKKYSGINYFYDRISNGRPIFEDIESENKILENIIKAEIQKNIISKNLKLVSFELLSRELDSPHSTEMIEKKRHIEDIIRGDNIASRDAMRSALERNGVFLEGTSIDFIYI
jgi:hypothetical protein